MVDNGKWQINTQDLLSLAATNIPRIHNQAYHLHQSQSVTLTVDAYMKSQTTQGMMHVPNLKQSTQYNAFVS